MMDRIQHWYDRLPRAEQRVAHWLLEQPHALASMRLTDLAAAAQVSDPTVVRFCRHVGCNGFSDLKLRLARDLATRTLTVHASVTKDDNADTVAEKVLSASLAELRRVGDALDSRTLQQAANRIAAARRLWFCGVGASGIVALDAHNKFFRLGLPCAAFTDGPTIAQVSATADHDTVVVSISKTGESAAVVQGMAIAQANSATAIALAAPGSPLALQADLPLLIDVSEDTATYTPMSSRLAQLAVLDILQVCTALAAGPGAASHLESSKRALRQHALSASPVTAHPR